MGITRRGVVAGAAGAGFVAAAPALAQVRALRVGDTSALPTSWPIYIADKKGYFRDEGLAVENIYTNSNPAVAQQTVAGNFDIGVTTLETGTRAIYGDAPLRVVASVMRGFPYMVMSSKNVRTAQDMKGKTVVLPLVKSLITVFWNRWLVENGMKVADVDQIYDAATPARYAALKSGAAQASVLGQPFDWIAEADGFNKLLDLGARVRDFGFTAVVARPDWLQKNGPEMKGFLRAVSRAVPFYQDPANREECADILMGPTKMDKANALRTWDYYVKDLKPFDKSLAITDKQLELVVGTLIELGDFKAGGDYRPSRFIDTSYLPAA
jgi:NitT/TauT family transport system substrate-binding protein